MPTYPSDFNDSTNLSFDTVIQRQAVQDNVASTGLSSLSQTTEPLGDMFKAISMLEVEIDNIKRFLLHNSLPVALATTAVLPGTVVYSNGTAGVGATITVADSSLGSIDGVAVATGDRILVKNQAAALQNGIYVATTVGVGNYLLTRATDADERSATEMSPGMTVVVRGGTANGKRVFICTSTSSIVMGLTNITFAEFTSQSQLPIGDETYILSVLAGTTTTLPSTAAIIYSNGTAGVGATLTRGENGAIGTIDGVTLAVGDRILVKNQASGLQNGVYSVTALGDGSNPYVLTRTTDADTSAEYATGLSVMIKSGTTNAGTWYKNTNTTAVTMGTTAITWSLYTSTNGSRPFSSNTVFPTNERTYFVNVYGSKLTKIRNDALEMAEKLKKMQVYMSGYTTTAGDQTPASNFYPSDKNRGW